MSVTFAVAAVRLARRDTLVQQMSATESLAAVDTICVDKTGTLTAGELRLAGVEFADGRRPGSRRRRRWAASPPAPATATAPWRRSPSASPARPARVSAEVPFSSEWKWSGVALADGAGGADLRARRARRPRRGRGADPAAAAWPRKLEEETAAGRRVVAFGQSSEALPADPAAARAAAAGAAGPGRAGGDAAPRRRRDDRLHARARKST